jgi:hypothetical protein
MPRPQTPKRFLSARPWLVGRLVFLLRLPPLITSTQRIPLKDAVNVNLREFAHKVLLVNQDYLDLVTLVGEFDRRDQSAIGC